VRLLTAAGIISAKVVNVDAANDLALLKAEGKFTVLPVAASRAVKLGGTVATVVFPSPGLQGFASIVDPTFARREKRLFTGTLDSELHEFFREMQCSFYFGNTRFRKEKLQA
jgi:hypothetical protein